MARHRRMISDRPWVCLANVHVRVSFFFTLTASSHARDDIDNKQDRAFVDPFVTPVDKKAEAPSQEINYSADFDAGWQLLIHRPTTTLPGKPTIAGRRRGSLKVKPSKHGKRRDPCCGSTANVSVFSSSIPLMCVDDSPIFQLARERVFFGMPGWHWSCFGGTHFTDQLRNYRRCS